jgi:hypothetical protein
MTRKAPEAMMYIIAHSASLNMLSLGMSWGLLMPNLAACNASVIAVLITALCSGFQRTGTQNAKVTVSVSLVHAASLGKM